MRRLAVLFLIVVVIALAALVLTRIGNIGSNPTTTTTEPCIPPFIRSGESCCLDSNGDEICDRDEYSSTTLEGSNSTSSTLITPDTNPTTTLTVRCRVNQDCGESREERICYENNIYIQSITYICSNPGTPGSFCKQKNILGSTPFQKCPNRCENVTCY